MVKKVKRCGLKKVWLEIEGGVASHSGHCPPGSAPGMSAISGCNEWQQCEVHVTLNEFYPPVAWHPGVWVAPCLD